MTRKIICDYCGNDINKHGEHWWTIEDAHTGKVTDICQKCGKKEFGLVPDEEEEK